MAEAAVEFLVENIKELLLTQLAGRPFELKSEIQQMHDELRQLKAFLGRLAIRKDEPFKEMRKQIREVVYDAEDTIDYLFTMVVATKAMNFVRRNIHRRRRLILANELISLRKDRLNRMSRRVSGMLDEIQDGDGEGNGSGTSDEREQTKEKEVPTTRAKNIVGLEDEAKTLINYLMEETEELDVISIAGMPGIGKTTLARNICQNEKIQEEFPILIWVDVPQECDARELQFNVLNKFSEQGVFLNIGEFPENKRFLLVMDDLWDVDSLGYILSILRGKHKMGKVLITSRNNNVCTNAYVARKPHKLCFLNEKESWELLQLEVFGKLDECPRRLKPMGVCVAKNCCGLPLALVVIAKSLLVAPATVTSMDLTEHWWKKVSENVTLYVSDYGKHLVSANVATSYNKMPDGLRHCFLYFGVFPEDYEIPAWTLTCLWIAEGFVQYEDEKSLEETAEEILDYLINSNLVLVDKIYPNGKVKTCRVHKVIHAFCKSEAAEENLFQEMKMSDGVFDPPISLIPNYRRLCIYSDLPEFLSLKPKGQAGIRSFLCFHKENTVLDPKEISAILTSFNFLRVWESNSIKFTKFPAKLTTLINLRYISLSCDDLSCLPATISELWNLQTLVVNTRWPSLVMEANIWRMIQLRHLITKAAIILARQGKGKGGENIQTLSRLSPECCTEEVFKRACNLKRLGIRGQLSTLLESESLRKLASLENLKLVNEPLDGSASNNQVINRLHVKFFPPNLKRLTLSGTHLNWGHMCLLGKIDTLQVLKLKNNAFVGYSWITEAGGFCHLEFLSISSANLVSWEASADCFPQLKCLVVKKCENLRNIPSSLAKSLEELDIEHLAKSAVDSAMEIQEEKVHMQGRLNGKLSGFKLSIGPGCE